MAAASEYVLEPIRDGAEFTLYRARQHGNPSPVLVIAPTPEQPLPQSLRRLEHNTRSQPNLSPRGQPSLWRSRVTKDGQSLFSPTPAVSLSTTFWNNTGSSLSIRRVFYALPLTWRRRSATSMSAV
jgi:hypothetical protein